MLVIFIYGENNFSADSAGPVEKAPRYSSTPANGEFGSHVSTRGAIKLDGSTAKTT